MARAAIRPVEHLADELKALGMRAAELARQMSFNDFTNTFEIFEFQPGALWPMNLKLASIRKWAVDAMQLKCPAPRWVVAPFGRQVDAGTTGGVSSEQLLGDPVFRAGAIARLRVEDPVGATATDAEIEQLIAWLTTQ